MSDETTANKAIAALVGILILTFCVDLLGLALVALA